ncbi:hypothetical protein [Devosia sp.]|uniref:hypothetical protein n=1 Tax=Devosia sp. TaxID=1871048 RepID=UPI001ACEA6AD|nr:hypothetical protein [Devosia sp.]MBN9309607.1 hypothetical protein [Devosia sp.]
MNDVLKTKEGFMPRLGAVRNSLIMLSLGAALIAPGAMAQSSPTDIPGVLSVCAPVIKEEYQADRTRWGQCIAAVDAFVKHIGAPSDATNPIIADLVAELVKLYEEQYCPKADTELPIAIELAAQSSTDAVQQAQIIEISATIRDCGVFATAAIQTAPSASAF